MLILYSAAPSTMLPPTIRVQSPILEVDEDFEEVESCSHSWSASQTVDVDDELYGQMQHLSVSIKRPKQADCCTSCGEDLLKLLGGCLTLYPCYCYTVVW